MRAECFFDAQTSDATSASVSIHSGLYSVWVSGSLGQGKLIIEASQDGATDWTPVDVPIFAPGVYMVSLPSNHIRFDLSDSSTPSVSVRIYPEGHAVPSLVRLGEVQIPSTPVAGQLTAISNTAAKRITANHIRPIGPVLLDKIPGATNNVYYGFDGSMTVSSGSFPINGLVQVMVDDLSKLWFRADAGTTNVIAYQYGTR